METEYEFLGRKPSRTQIKRKIFELTRNNPLKATVIWGENWIEAIRIGKESGHYIGTGWIGNNSGADIVREAQGPGGMWKV